MKFNLRFFSRGIWFTHACKDMGYFFYNHFHFQIIFQVSTIMFSDSLYIIWNVFSVRLSLSHFSILHAFIDDTHEGPALWD